jgi:hypothetical protein
VAVKFNTELQNNMFSGLPFQKVFLLSKPNLFVLTSGFHHNVNEICALWDLVQCTLVICYQYLGTTYRSPLQEDCLTLEDGTSNKLPTYDA